MGCACSALSLLSAWVHLLLAQGSLVCSCSAGLAAALGLSFANIQTMCLQPAQPLEPGSWVGSLNQRGFAGTLQ